jgi:hypothetical protein
MELADKSLGDLLRRLPVIVMEDSMLHPHLGFLVWLMIAHSKDYAIPRVLVMRVFRIVFEVASCQWKDDEKAWDPRGFGLPSTTVIADSSHKQDLCLSALHHEMVLHNDESHSPSVTNPSHLLLWSLLARADYGGMRCDVGMLLRFAGMWHARFQTSGVPANLIRRWGLLSLLSDGQGQSDSGSVADHELLWRDVPLRLHERAMLRSAERVAILATEGIESLTIDDISVEGVDFHCSLIVDHLLTLPAADLCRDLILLSNGPHESEVANSTTTEEALKYCLWHYSSGVNRRQPLVAQPLPGHLGTPDSGRGPPKYEEMWNQLFAEEARRYQVSYVRERLSRTGKS